MRWRWVDSFAVWVSALVDELFGARDGVCSQLSDDVQQHQVCLVEVLAIALVQQLQNTLDFRVVDNWNTENRARLEMECLVNLG